MNKAPPLDPLLAWVLQVAKLPIEEVQAWRCKVLSYWEVLAERCSEEIPHWRSTLPDLCRRLYEKSGFNGPLFYEMFKFLRQLGYPDVNLWHDICNGFPSGQVPSARISRAPAGRED